MNRKTLALVLATMALAGCTLNRTALRTDLVQDPAGGNGRVIEPRRCSLQVVILSRPIRDEAINATIWRVADEQAVAPEARRALEANGLRAGLITGEIPAEVDAILKAPPPNKVEPAQFELPDGERTLVSLTGGTPQVSLLLNREGRASGKDYTDASGWFRVTTEFDGATGVKLRFVPEIHHGPIQHTFGAVPNAGAYAPQQFMLKDGQQEETLRELAATLTVQPGQVVVLGCRAEATRNLGSFLFTQPEANSDRLVQKLLLIWASRNSLGLPGNDKTPPSGVEPVKPPQS